MSASEVLASSVPPRLEKIPLPLLDNAIAAAIDNAKEASASFQPNSSQQKSIAWALKRSLSLIQGPAGTGKTLCAALLIAAALRLHPTPPTCHLENNNNNPQQKAVESSPRPRVLAVAHSNGAADVLLQALLSLGVPAVRVGRPASVLTELRHRTVVAMADKHPEVKRLRAKAMDMTLDRYERNAAAYEVTRCINEVRHMISTTTPVLVASCIGAHQLLQEGFGSSSGNKDSAPSFPIVVLDEAAQTTEPALMCALAAAKAEQVIFVGDTQQLPPTVASDAKELRDTLGVSPMARLEASHVGQRTLCVQYRMAPALLQFPSRYFYNGLVTCAESLLSQKNTDTKPPAGFPWPNSQPIAFVRVGPNLETAHELGGKSNPTEADLVVKIVLGLLSGNQVDARGIAIISPYARQVQLLRTMLSARNVDDIRVGTVDSFQGQETNLVVFSAVRSNSMSEIGFLRDPRRLCVALTRARRGLIVVGDPNVLQSSRPWSALLDSCHDRDCFLERQDLEVQYKSINNEKDKNKGDILTIANDTSDAALRAALQESLEADDGLDELFATVPDASGT